MPPATLLVREERIQDLQSFCRTLLAALQQGGVDFANAAELLRASVSGECPECRTRVSGEELFQLSQTEGAPDPSLQVKCLRLGYCVQPGCKSYRYRLQFQEREGIDWPAIATQAAKIKSSEAAVGAKSFIRFLSARDVRRVGVALVVLVLLLILRQWYLGGRIPLLREPEKFRAAPAPEHNSENPD